MPCIGWFCYMFGHTELNVPLKTVYLFSDSPPCTSHDNFTLYLNIGNEQVFCMI